MELLEVHYTAPRRAFYLNFLQSSGESGYSESGLLIQRTYKKTAVGTGNRKPRKSDRLFGFKNRRLSRQKITAVSDGFKNLINGLTTVIEENGLKPRFRTLRDTAFFFEFFSVGRPAVKIKSIPTKTGYLSFTDETCYSFLSKICVR